MIKTSGGLPLLQEADFSCVFGDRGDMMIRFVQQHDDTSFIYRILLATNQEPT